jgi:WD40 repeat protein
MVFCGFHHNFFLGGWAGQTSRVIVAYLALSSLNDTVNIYRCDHEEYVPIGSLRCDGGGEHVVHCFTHDLSSLVCSLGGRVIKWDITALTSVSSEAPLPVIYDEGSEWVVDIGYEQVRTVASKKSSSQLLVFSKFPDNYIAIYDYATRQEVWKWDSEFETVFTVDLMRHNELIIARCVEHFLIVDSTGGNVVNDVIIPRELYCGEEISVVAAHPIYPYVAVIVGCSVGILALTDQYSAANEAATRRLMGHTANVSCICFSDCNERLLSGGEDETIRVWSVSTWETLFVVAAGDVRSVTYSCHLNHIACCIYKGNKIRIFDCESCQLVAGTNVIDCGLTLCYSQGGSVILM